ncbi:MAG: PaaI family thioesterase [Acetobacteraceae bacterium]
MDLSCHFTGASRMGRVIATGTLVSHGRSLYFARSEVLDEAGRVLAFGTSTHKWRRASENIEGSPPG